MPTLFLGNHIGNGHNIKIQRTAPQIPDFALDFCPPLILALDGTDAGSKVVMEPPRVDSGRLSM